MEFFAWIAIPQLIYNYFIDLSKYGYHDRLVYIAVCCAVAGALFLVSLVFGGLGLMRMAKEQGVKHGWLGFLPFANTYLAGKLAGESNFFGQKMKRAGLYAMLTEIAYVAVSIFSLVMSAYLINPAYYRVEATGYGERYVRVPELVPPNLRWMITGEFWCGIFSYLVEILLWVMFFVVYIALFRKYYARGPILMAFLSAFLPLRGFVLFAVRKNTPVDYNAYLRRRMAEMQAGQYGAPYGGQGGYGQQTGTGGYGAPPQDESPYSDFGGEGGGQAQEGSAQSDQDDPFSEFN